MISQALGVICTELRQHLGLEPNAVRSSSRPAIATGPRHATATLVGVREPGIRQTPPSTREPTLASTPLIELDLLLSFGGSDYDEALDLLAKTIDFFRAHPIWSAESLPGMDSSPLPTALGKITLHAVELSLEDQHHLWSTLGAPYMPSVVYRVTLVTAEAR